MAANQQNLKSTEDNNLPDWLREIRGASSAPKPEQETQPTPKVDDKSPPPTDGGDLPSWLQDDQPDSSVPATQQIQTPSPPPVESSGDEGEDLWKQILAEEGLSLDEIEDEVPEGAENVSVKEWMASTADASAKRLAQAAAAPPKARKPDPVPEPEPEPEPITSTNTLEDDGIVVEDDLPDWLKGDQPSGDAPASLDWLTDESVIDDVVEDIEQPVAETDSGPATLQDDGIVIEDELPDWLREDQPSGNAPESLDWLTDESVIDDVTENVEQPATEKDTPSQTLQDDGIVVEDELPDWLREDQSDSDDSASLSWLTDESVVNDVQETATDQTPSTPVSQDDGIVIEDELPDWLREDQSDGEASDTLDWLSDESTLDEPETQATQPDSTPAIEDDGIVVEDELPDWLREDQSDGEANESLSWLTDESVVEDYVDTAIDDVSTDSGEGLPDWLQESDTSADKTQVEESVATESLADTTEDDGIVDRDGLPDWLQEAEGTITADDDVPDWLVDNAEASTQDNVPDWLQSATGETDSEQQSVTTEDSNLPDWLDESVDEGKTETIVGDKTTAQHDVTVKDVAPQVATPRTAPKDKLTNDAVKNSLSMAKTALTKGNLDKALQIAHQLISRSQALNEVIASLTESLPKYINNPSIYEVLGDAQMRDGQLNQALQSYKSALDKL